MLNDAKIRAAKPREKAYKLTDSHRLYLLVKPGGSKLWKWNYACGGKQKTMHLGIHRLVSLVDARAMRDEARAQLDDGRDPSTVKRLRIAANLNSAQNTFERIARDWHGTIKAQWAGIHADDVIRSLERDVFSAVGDLPIAELSPPVIMSILTVIEDRGAIETAKRVRQRISAGFVLLGLGTIVIGALTIRVIRVPSNVPSSLLVRVATVVMMDVLNSCPGAIPGGAVPKGPAAAVTQGRTPNGVDGMRLTRPAQGDHYGVVPGKRQERVVVSAMPVACDGEYWKKTSPVCPRVVNTASSGGAIPAAQNNACAEARIAEFGAILLPHQRYSLAPLRYFLSDAIGMAVA